MKFNSLLALGAVAATAYGADDETTESASSSIEAALPTFTVCISSRVVTAVTIAAS